MGPTLTLSARQPPASAMVAATSSGVTESSSPVILNSAILRGTVTLAGSSFSVAAIRLASRDALLPASWQDISNSIAPVTAFLSLSSLMSSSESLISLFTIDIASLYVKRELSLTVSDTAAHRGSRRRPSTFSSRVFRPPAVRPFPFATVRAPSPPPAPRMDSRPARGRTGGRATTSAKVLIFIPDPPLPAVAPRAETPVRSVDDDRDSGTRPPDLALSVGAWAVGRGCAAGFLFFHLDFPLPPPVTDVNPASSADDSTVDREVSLVTRDCACTVLAAAATSVARRITPAGFISRHHSSNLRRNRILISSSGSRGPGPLDLGLSASLLLVLPPSPSGHVLSTLANLSFF